MVLSIRARIQNWEFTARALLKPLYFAVGETEWLFKLSYSIGFTAHDFIHSFAGPETCLWVLSVYPGVYYL